MGCSWKYDEKVAEVNFLLYALIRIDPTYV